MSNTQTTIIQVPAGKSPVVAGILTFLFGPIGPLYTSPMWGLILAAIGSAAGKAGAEV